jgi:hypothetical protein
MMSTVRPLPFHRLARATCFAAVLLGAAWHAAVSRAGEAGASFQVTVQVIPEAPGSCSASTEFGAPQLTCRPSVVGSVASGTGGDARQQRGAIYRRGEAPVRVAGELVEVGAENYYAWLENHPTAWSERSSRRVVAGGREYVETTFSW